MSVDPSTTVAASPDIAPVVNLAPLELNEKVMAAAKVANKITAQDDKMEE